MVGMRGAAGIHEKAPRDGEALMNGGRSLFETAGAHLAAGVFWSC
jgi:hypothetical protein